MNSTIEQREIYFRLVGLPLDEPLDRAPKGGVGCRILLAEDHPLVREVVTILLKKEGFQVIAEVADGIEAVSAASELRPDIAILDLSMPSLNGIEAARVIGQASPRTRTILLTAYNEKHYVLNAIRAGVHGYVLKSQASVDLAHAVRTVLLGERYLSPALSPLSMEQTLSAKIDEDEVLTSRERQVLQLITEGRTSKDTAARMGRGVKTVETHRLRIMNKLKVNNVAGLVRYAIRSGIIQP